MATRDMPGYGKTLIDNVPQSGQPLVMDGVAVEGLIAAMQADLTSHWQPAAPEIISPSRENTLGLVLVRKRRQLAYSLKLSNFTRDPLATLQALSATSGLVAGSVPPSFWAFAATAALAWTRTFMQPMPYGEAALLHLMNQIAERDDFVTDEHLQSAGPTLVSQYGFVKGNNSNEIASLITSLTAWGAIEPIDGGYRVLESVPFGLGRYEYIED